MARGGDRGREGRLAPEAGPHIRQTRAAPAPQVGSASQILPRERGPQNGGAPARGSEPARGWEPPRTAGSRGTSLWMPSFFGDPVEVLLFPKPLDFGCLLDKWGRPPA